MLRVNKDNLCPICHKPDWCLVSEDGKAAICARIKEGSTCSAGEAGYLHILDEKYVAKPYVPPEYPSIDWNELAQKYYHGGWNYYDGWNYTEKLSKDWNVSKYILDNLFIGWDGEAYTIPMRDGKGNIIGIHRRFPDGEKCAVSGSKNGLFYSQWNWTNGPSEIIIVEGASDCATILDMGFYAIGRANCNSGTEYIKEFIKNNPSIKKVLIIADNDEAGMRGARKLFCGLNNHGVYYIPPIPFKDVRAWRQNDPNIKETIEEWLRKL